MGVETTEDRVEEALTAAGLTAAAVLRRHRLGKNSLSEWKSGRKMPESFLRIVLQDCQRAGLAIDGHWLLTGDGEMLRTPKGSKEYAFDAIARYVDHVRKGGNGDHPLPGSGEIGLPEAERIKIE